MTEDDRLSLRALWRRVEEVRGVPLADPGAPVDTLDDPESLVRAMSRLVEELEASHRRLIESHIQLASLREVAGTLATTRDAAEATRLVVRYLRGVLEFEQVGLLLVDRERGVLTGTWGHGAALVPIEVPLVEGEGAALRALWQHRAVRHADPRRHPVMRLPEGHPLAAVFAEHASFACVPLEPTGSVRDAVAPAHCGACRVGRASALVPPPGADPAEWRAQEEDTRRRCIGCDHLPLLGVLVAARGAGAAPEALEQERLESVAYALSPMVENARLVHDLARQQRFLADLVDSMPSALVSFDTEGRALSLNRTAQDLLGRIADEAVGLDTHTLLGPEGATLLDGTLTRGEAVSRRETTLVTAAGTPLPVRLTTASLRDEQGRPYGALATFLDLTPLRAAEERARQMDRLAALGRFTSSVAHEIRNPLTGIGMGVRRMARALRDQPREAEHVEFVVSEIRRLDGIVQQLFDVTHPRRLDLSPRPLAETLRRAARSVEAVCEERGVTLECHVPPGLPEVPHDPEPLQQVLINLFKNAAEASASGAHVRVEAVVGKGTVTVRVRDEGCGMDAETQRTLFEPFFTTKPKGTGLGLYVSQDIVRRHGGSLTVSSEPGRGTTFTLELPCEPQGGTR